MRGDQRTMLGDHLLLPPCNIGPRSTPNYPALADEATYALADGVRFFAGQRLDGFYVDLGSVFDLGALRPFQNLHFIPLPPPTAQRAARLQRALDRHPGADRPAHPDGSAPTDPMAPEAVIGVWASAHRQKGRFTDETATTRSGPFTQVSRLGNPLVNEVLIPIGLKDGLEPRRGPATTPSSLSTSPARSWPRCCRCCTPAPSPTWRPSTPIAPTSSRSSTPASPRGSIPGFQNFTGTTEADMLRLNVAIPPSATPQINGILAGDLAGFPNGRRVTDDVTTIELRAVAGATYPLIDNSFTPDAAAGAIYDLQDSALPWNVSYLDAFPYLDHPRQRLRDQLAVGAARERHARGITTTTITLASVRPCSTSAATSGRSSPPSIRRWRERNCSCAPTTSRRSTVHTGVWDRHDAGTAVTAAVFPELAAGTYHVLDERGVVVRTVDVRGGEVTTIDLRR